MKIFILCPLSEEQKPINEYIRFKKNQRVNWAMRSQNIYTKYVILVYRNILVFFVSGACLITTPCFFKTQFCVGNTFNLWSSVLGRFALVSFFPGEPTLSEISSLPDLLSLYPKINLSEILLNMNQISLLIFLTIFGVFFFFWRDLSKNLKKSYLLYEEGSWYQIQRWEKPLFLIKNDRLINNKRLCIVKDRMYYTLGLSALLACFFIQG